jgi:hypothetical protein
MAGTSSSSAAADDDPVGRGGDDNDDDGGDTSPLLDLLQMFPGRGLHSFTFRLNLSRV